MFGEFSVIVVIKVIFAGIFTNIADLFFDVFIFEHLFYNDVNAQTLTSISKLIENFEYLV